MEITSWLDYRQPQRQGSTIHALPACLRRQPRASPLSVESIMWNFRRLQQYPASTIRTATAACVRGERPAKGPPLPSRRQHAQTPSRALRKHAPWRAVHEPHSVETVTKVSNFSPPCQCIESVRNHTARTSTYTLQTTTASSSNHRSTCLKTPSSRPGSLV